MSVCHMVDFKEGGKTAYCHSVVEPGCRLSTMMGDFNRRIVVTFSRRTFCQVNRWHSLAASGKWLADFISNAQGLKSLWMSMISPSFFYFPFFSVSRRQLSRSSRHASVPTAPHHRPDGSDTHILVVSSCSYTRCLWQMSVLIPELRRQRGSVTVFGTVWRKPSVWTKSYTEPWLLGKWTL